MKKQEIIDESEYNQHPLASNQEEIEWNNALDLAIDIIKEKLNEPEKVAIPQYVVDWLEVCKENLALSLASSMNPIVLRTNNQSERTIYWFKSAKNQETFAKAWIYGYEVEKEKLYTVELPNPHGLGHTVLVKDMYGNTFITYTTDSNWREGEVNHLTESEIKKDFPWVWQFAEEVEE